MPRRTGVWLTASAMIGIASIVTASAGDLPTKKSTSQRATQTVAVVPAPVPARLIDNNYGPIASGIPQCINSAIYYPIPPCY